ncbi:MAG: trypsin-like peptidase domain-containing protein [Planctomycetes bacterium]|nr:trypsin-like peptidase domain-containing protein [Planctomycetota bacterium]
MRLFALLAVVALPLVACAEEEAEKVYRVANPSVVGLENPEESGTGIIISEGGLILTNAHVLGSPLKYRVLVDVGTDKSKRTVVFNNPKVVGFHPDYDLALLRIDPAEQGIHLTAAKLLRSKAGPGKRVYAIGNPAISGVTLTKSITDGMLSAADRDIDGLSYYQFSAQINPGNSGGPLLDKDANVLGLVTFKLTDMEGVGFAIPLHNFDASKFLPSLKTKDAATAQKLCVKAEEYYNLSRKYAARDGKSSENAMTCRAIALYLWREALRFDPENGGIWHNVGIAWGSLEERKIAIAYLVRAHTVRPWEGGECLSSFELGMQLVNDGQKPAGYLALREGCTKYPYDAYLPWRNVAIVYAEDGKWEEAGYCAASALRCHGADRSKTQPIVDEARSKLTGEALKRLDDRLAKVDEDLKKAQEVATAAQKAGKRFLLPEFEKWLKDYENSNGMPSDAAGPGKAEVPAEPPTAPPPAEDAAAKWIQSKLNMAKSFDKNGMRDKAVAALEEIMDKYPDHVEAKEAKRLLEKWKSK